MRVNPIDVLARERFPQTAGVILGIVGAGGIGQELKGRYDLYNYGHVATILLAIFVTRPFA
mgnify:CR=1 FL=1